MGWFKKLKGVFNGINIPDDSVQTTEWVELTVLLEWFELKLSKRFAPMIEGIKGNLSQFEDGIELLKERLEALKNAELHNKDIPEREFNIMDGNRNSYISFNGQFIERLNIPDDLSYESAVVFCSEFDESLNWLAKATTKSAYVLSHFFANEAGEVNKRIKEMASSVENIKNELGNQESGLKLVQDSRKLIQELNFKYKLLKDIEEELVLFNKKLENSKNMKDKLINSLEQIKSGDSYSKFRNLDTEKESLQNEMKQVEADLYHVFSQLDRPMRKFERLAVEDVTILGNYLDNPVTAVVEDESLKICIVLSKVKDGIDKGSIELKDADKAIERINKVTRAFLTTTRNKIVDIKGAIKSIDQRSRDSKVMMEIDDINYKLNHTATQIKLLIEKIGRLERQKSKINIPMLISTVSDKIKDTINIQVNIKCVENNGELDR